MVALESEVSAQMVGAAKRSNMQMLRAEKRSNILEHSNVEGWGAGRQINDNWAKSMPFVKQTLEALRKEVRSLPCGRESESVGERGAG